MVKYCFDLLITLCVTITALPAVILLYSRAQRKNSWEFRHRKITGWIASALLAISAVIIYGSFIEPRFLVVNYQNIDLPDIANPIKIALIADLQVGPYRQTANVEKVVNRVLELQPDIVLIAGDQVDNEATEEDETIYLTPLKKLTDAIPTYAVHGNHEYGIGGDRAITNPRFRLPDVSQRTKSELEKLGVKYLVNQLEKVEINPTPFCGAKHSTEKCGIKNTAFYLFGGDEYWSWNLNFNALKNRTEQIPTIALIHNPSFQFSPYPKDIDLVLSGHTHGGQIRLPFIGPVGNAEGTLPREQYQGLRQISEQTQMFVTSGVGETATRARLFNPPEIVLLTLY
ncbi:MAG: metallophosphoesterase [Candidatus Magasanikbacteria bacterium]|nr:metallophosphoesterase [Candidatus Magasanikbacteria bacterium]